MEDDSSVLVAPARYACSARGENEEEEHAFIIGGSHDQEIRKMTAKEV